MLIRPARPCGPVEENSYPYLVVRLMATVYQRERLDVRVGEPAARVGYRSSFVSHPEPFEEGKRIGAACRQLLKESVLDAVRRTRFRMCIVWGADECTFVEPDGSFVESDDPPSGGFGSGGVGGIPLPMEIDFVTPPVPYVENPQQRPS